MKNSDALRKAMEQAQQHIKKGEYDKGRAILEKIDAKVDNPTVKKWLAQLDKIAPKDDLFGDLEFPDVVGNPAQKKKGRSWVRILAGGVVLLCLCSFIGSMMGEPDDKPRPTRAAVVVATDTPVPTNSDGTTNTPAPTATVTNTATITNTPTDDPRFITMTAINVMIQLTENAPRPTATATIRPTPDSSLEAIQIESNLRGLTDVRIEGVQIADGRANGGERTVIITYTSAASDAGGMGEEWGAIFFATAATMGDKNIDLDSISLVIGDLNGTAIGIVVADIEDLRAYLDGDLSATEFFGRLTIEEL